MILAQRIPDAQEKHAVLEQGLMRWARRDPSGVDAFIEKYPITAELRRFVTAAKALAGVKAKSRSDRAAAAGGGE